MSILVGVQSGQLGMSRHTKGFIFSHHRVELVVIKSSCFGVSRGALKSDTHCKQVINNGRQAFGTAVHSIGLCVITHRDRVAGQNVRQNIRHSTTMATSIK